MSGRKLNIGLPSSAKDAAYRYKMDRLVTKIEGRGNGIKTVLLNVCDIAGQMKTDAKYITKYLGIEVGAQSLFDDDRNCGIVNGKHEAPALQAELQKFIEMFILCPHCNFPELHHKIKKKRIEAQCMSCGWNDEIPSAHRVLQYIKRIGSTKKTKTKKSGRVRKPRNAEVNVNRSANQKSQKKRPEEIDWSKEYANWYMDPDFELTKQNRSYVKAVDNEERAKYFRTEAPPEGPVALLKYAINTPGTNLVNIVSEFERIKLADKLEQQELKLGKTLVDATFGAVETYEQFLTDIEKHKELLSCYANDKDCALILMGYIEKTISDKNFMLYTPLILCKFYDCEIFDDYFFRKWHLQPPENSYVLQDVEEVQCIKKHAKPFIDWILQHLEVDKEDTKEEEIEKENL